MDWSALGVSLTLALVTSMVLLPVAIPIALWLVFSPGRWRTGIEAALMLPFVLPPAVLGFYLLTVLAKVGLAFTFTSLCIGALILNLPIAIQSFAEAFRGVNRELLDVAASFGAKRWQTFYHHIMPMTWPGLLNGLILIFAHTLGEFGVAMMVGGNLPGRTRTLSIAVYDSVQSLDLYRAHSTALAQILLGFGLLCCLSVLKQKYRKQHYSHIT